MPRFKLDDVLREQIMKLHGKRIATKDISSILGCSSSVVDSVIRCNELALEKGMEGLAEYFKVYKNRRNAEWAADRNGFEFEMPEKFVQLELPFEDEQEELVVENSNYEIEDLLRESRDILSEIRDLMESLNNAWKGDSNGKEI